MDEAARPAVDVRRLRVVLGDQTVLRGIDLTAAAGSRVGLVGPNGAGKSTLLRALAGLLRPERGTILLNGVELAEDPWHGRRAVGVVGHQPMLYPELTARENLQFYARLYGLPDAGARADEGLRRVGLEERAGSRAGALSRGMLQRVALARALLHDPSILLLDEAESGLDAVATDHLLDVLRAEHGRRTVILASHDLSFVQAAAEHVVLLRAGRVVETLDLAGQTLSWLQEQYANVLTRSARPHEAGVPALTTTVGVGRS
ncbi:MAG: ABC transporter ATP-binding protein [Chloroflexi bacterium]|nr:ABC transporter ATP-binding protein [Chloroflexota bacterium]